MTPRTASIIGGLGRTFIGLGVLILSFAAFQLWGTNWQEARAQSALEDEFDAQRAAVAELAPDLLSTTTTTAPVEGQTTAVPETTTTLAPEVLAELAAELLPEMGESMGRIAIPSIGVDKGLVHGTRRDDLRAGPGHYPGTPFPGQPGNTAIAGHRTTYGAPFHDLDLVQPGDQITLETLYGTFYYEVLPHTDEQGNELGYFIVDDTAVEVVDDQGDNRLTLTACHPKYSAAQRIVVSARLVSAPAPVLPTTTSTAPPIDDTSADDAIAGDPVEQPVADETVLAESLGWNLEERTPTLLWAAASALVAVAGWLFGRAWRRWPAYLVISPVFLAVLWGFFTHLDRLLPAL